MEESILLFIQECLRNRYLNDIMKLITHLGDYGTIWICIILICLLSKNKRQVGMMMVLALVLSLIFNNLLLKNMVMRIRPYDAIEGLSRLIEAQSDYSFPSAHSASSFAAAGVIFLTTDRKYGISAIVLAILIAFSRLYVGVHYPSDVLFGVLSGFLMAYISVKIFKKFNFK